MTPEVLERTACGVWLEDADGDRRFVLTTCPVCAAPLAPDQHDHDRAEPVAAHLHRKHFPEDFGLSRDERDYQAKLNGGVRA